jgi:hypothetical protein
MKKESKVKRELRYWKNLQLNKKYNTNLNPIKENEPQEMLDQQIVK